MLKFVFRNTSRYPNEEVERLCQFVLEGHDLEGLGLWVKDRQKGAFKGLARSANTRGITVCVGAPDAFPASSGQISYSFKKMSHDLFVESENVRKVWDRSGRVQYMRIRNADQPYGGPQSVIYNLENWAEGIVAITAHEFNHVLQYREHQATHGPQSWPKRASLEAECEHAANDALKRYRTALAREEFAPPQATLRPTPITYNAASSTSDRIRALASQGKTRSEIAKILGVRYQQVRQTLEKDAKGR
jgi:hypothetical protein